MAFEVKYSEQAAIDLDAILDYISNELYSPKAAYDFYLAVKEKHVYLSDNPYIYPLSNDEKLRSEGYHSVAVKNYIIFYLIDEDESIVNIARILFSRRDILSVFYDTQ